MAACSTHLPRDGMKFTGREFNGEELHMRFTLEADANHYLITRYGPGWISVNEREFHQSLLVTPEKIIADWPPQSLADCTEGHFAAVAALEPEIVLLGTGTRQQFPHPRLLSPLTGKGIGVEIMDTAAACRTYNIVMMEGRRVVAALMMIGA